MDLEIRRQYKAFKIRALMAMAENPENPPTVAELAERFGCEVALLEFFLSEGEGLVHRSPAKKKTTLPRFRRRNGGETPCLSGK